MHLANPAYLWALTGLLAPLAIHLLSRKAGKVIQVGSIRHLTESDTLKFSAIRFNESLLFFIRALIFLLFVLILSGLYSEQRETTTRWVLLEAAPEAAPELHKSLDSLRGAGYELRYLAEGFPKVEPDVAAPRPDNYAHLVFNLGKAGVEAVVYARNRLEAFRGPKQVLPENIQWLQLPGEFQSDVLQANRTGPDTIRLLSGETAPERTSFSKRMESIPTAQTVYVDPPTGTEASIRAQPPLQVLLQTRGSTKKQTELIEAGIWAIADFSGRKIAVDKMADRPVNQENYDCIIGWAPDLFSESSTIIQFGERQEEPGRSLVQTGPKTWRFSGPVTRQAVLREHLLFDLARILLRDPQIEQLVRNWDQRTIDERIFFDRTSPAVAVADTPDKYFDNILIISILFMFALERIVAFYRRA